MPLPASPLEDASREPRHRSRMPRENRVTARGCLETKFKTTDAVDRSRIMHKHRVLAGIFRSLSRVASPLFADRFDAQAMLDKHGGDALAALNATAVQFERTVRNREDETRRNASESARSRLNGATCKRRWTKPARKHRPRAQSSSPGRMPKPTRPSLHRSP
ncbi:MAG: hypothetical protein HC933_09155 [Pleurocapsa sp. SU_196_0]|nr:hypothetical protein [Pleurocapsa sp. SU_196_0]